MTKSSMKVMNLETIIDKDLATQWIQFHPCKTKTSQEVERSLRKFLEPSEKPKISTDSSLEFGELTWNHCTSTPQRSEANGIAERAVRKIKEGSSAVCSYNPDWMKNGDLRNIQHLLAGGKTPYEMRSGEPFKGPVIPFWSNG